jgi:hypothetical protein
VVRGKTGHFIDFVAFDRIKIMINRILDVNQTINQKYSFLTTVEEKDH